MMLSRRNTLAALGGLLLGGAMTATAGLSYRAYRRSLTTTVPPDIIPVDEAGWVLSDEDRKALLAIDRFATSERLAVRQEVDIPGGDYARVQTGSLQECVAHCEKDPSCEAFTYASSRHPVPDKRRVCWLKGEGTSKAVGNAAHYVSGRRNGW